jgi:hypothetical protein
MIEKAKDLLTEAHEDYGNDAVYKIRFGGSTPILTVESYDGQLLAEYHYRDKVLVCKQFE